MMIDLDLLLAWGATYKKYSAGEFVFNEGANCNCYYQLVEGQIKWANYTDEGKEFIQTLIEPGECFGEIPLFDEGPYVSSAVTMENSIVIKLPRDLFHQLIKENSDISFKFCQLLSHRLRYKFMLLKTNAFENPENRITALLSYYKKKKCLNSGDAFKVNLTRQQIANMTGLRVETVIRTIRHLSDMGSLNIVNGKVFI